MKRDYITGDSARVFIEKLESYADAFELTARTSEQKDLAAGFRELVDTVSPYAIAKAVQPAAERAGEDNEPDLDR